MAACSEEAARRHIERMARARQEGSDELKDSLAGAIERVTMMFPQTGHFLMEFLQNADDAGSRSILVELAPEAVRIANDGTPFSEADVESICRVGRSAKKATDYIGYLGIGFKSVFLFCDSPRIVSGCYRFAFDRQHWPQPEKVPWQITPVWLEQAPEWTKRLSSYTTFFELPIRERDRAAIAERLAEEIEPDSLSGRVPMPRGRRRVVPVLLEHEQWWYVAALLLFPGGGGPDVINDELLRPLRRYVEERPLLLAADGSLITAAQAMRIPNWDAGYAVARGGTGEGGDVEFFQGLYRELGRYTESTIRAPWFSARIVFSEDGSLVPASAACWAKEGPSRLAGLRRVHPELWADPGCARFLEILGCRVLTSEQVRDRQLGESLEQVAQGWAAMPEQERIAWTGGRAKVGMTL